MLLITKPCAICGTPMLIRRMTKVTCSTTCRVKLHHQRRLLEQTTHQLLEEE